MLFYFVYLCFCWGEVIGCFSVFLEGGGVIGILKRYVDRY